MSCTFNHDLIDESLNPQLAGWVKPVKNHPSKALCSFCLRTAVYVIWENKHLLITSIVGRIKNISLLVVLNISSFFKKFSNVSTTVQAATKTATCTHISSKVVTSTTTSSVS